MKLDKNEELNELKSSLTGSNISLPYTVPDRYFSDLNSRIMQNEMAERNSMPVIKEMPYSVPCNYFDGLAKQVIKKTSSKKKKGVLVSFAAIRWAAAAMLLLMVGAAVTRLHTTNSTNSTTDAIAVLADNDIEAYVADNYRADIGRLTDASYLGDADVQMGDIIAYLDETGWDTEYYY